MCFCLHENKKKPFYVCVIHTWHLRAMLGTQQQGEARTQPCLCQNAAPRCRPVAGSTSRAGWSAAVAPGATPRSPLPAPYLFLFFPSPPPAHLLLCIKASSQLHQSLVAAQERATQSAVAGCHHGRRWRGCRPHSSRRPVPRASDAAGSSTAGPSHAAQPRDHLQGSTFISDLSQRDEREPSDLNKPKQTSCMLQRQGLQNPEHASAPAQTQQHRSAARGAAAPHSLHGGRAGVSAADPGAAYIGSVPTRGASPRRQAGTGPLWLRAAAGSGTAEVGALQGRGPLCSLAMLGPRAPGYRSSLPCCSAPHH